MTKVHHGDLFEVLPTLDADSLDACVCDPPYGLEFMGKEWDKLQTSDNPSGPQSEGWHDNGGKNPYARRATPRYAGKELGSKGETMRQQQEWHYQWACEVLRVLKPGAHLVAFGGTRTFHRLTCALEDAGFEVRDCLMWLYGSGFPKSLDVSKAIDRAGGAVRENKFAGSFDRRSGPTGNRKCETCGKWLVSGSPCQCPRPQDAAQTDDAKQWAGWGTALKPGWEPIILARKPLVGTVAENVLKYGTGALHIDGCRIHTTDSLNGGAYAANPTARTGAWSESRVGDTNVFRRGGAGDYEQPQGRWPANVVLDEEAAAQLDEQSSESKSVSGGRSTRGDNSGWSISKGMNTPGRDVARTGHNDSGGASRFFYTAKPARSERDLGCYDQPAATGGEATDREDGTAGLDSPRAGAGRKGGSRNVHPTVKPMALMRWLVRLVTPPEGTVLDPFMGSGTTGMACRAEMVAFVGIERDAAYVAIAEQRLASIAPLFYDTTDETPEPPETPDQIVVKSQGGLF